MAKIRFRCIRCQHTVEAAENKVGKKMYCPVCYYELTVPAESTIAAIDESRLYAADTTPIDVREMKDRRRFASLPCVICHTNIAVPPEQIGLEVECPECGTKQIVPESLAGKFAASTEDKLDRIMLGLEPVPDRDVYGVRDATAATDDGIKRFPVHCKLCGTLMYATEEQVGQELTCPDCETKTLVEKPRETKPAEPLAAKAFEGETTFDLAGGEKRGPLVPVVCSLCGTRMYARDSEIGGFKTCPDCGRRNEIKAVPQEAMSVALPIENPDGSYDVNGEELPATRPTFRTLTDYRHAEGSLDKELFDRAPRSNLAYDDSPYRESDKKTLRRRHKERKPPKPVEEPNRPPELPEHPFWTRLFVPFKSALLLARLFGAVLFGSIALIVGLLLPGLLFAVGLPIGLLVLFLVVALHANTCSSLFLWTTAGNDLPEKDDWQELTLGGGTAFGAWLLLLAALAGVPGLFLAQVLSGPEPNLAKEVDTASRVVVLLVLACGSSWIFFPILFLSCMETDSYFSMLAKGTLTSVLHETGVWVRFYLVSFCLAVPFGLGLLLPYLFLDFKTKSDFVPALGWIMFLLVIASAIYFRLLGRLGQVLEEKGREVDEEEE